jgi:hypothetical protein
MLSRIKCLRRQDFAPIRRSPERSVAALEGGWPCRGHAGTETGGAAWRTCSTSAERV